MENLPTVMVTAAWLAVGAYGWYRSVKELYAGGHAEFWRRVFNNGTREEYGPLFGAAIPFLVIISGPISLLFLLLSWRLTNTRN